MQSVVVSRPRDLGGFSVRRVLPAVARKMVGPFIFFDHMGPAEFEPGHGIDVRPHPHIGLATVTFLFEGAIMHRDSLGFAQVINPGDVNWMTAGTGIVHSERTPPDLRASGHKLDGIQAWVALPREHEDTTPSFAHHPASTLPEFTLDGVRLKLLVGSAFDRTSPVHALSDMLYLDAWFPAGSRLTLPAGDRELGVYLARGALTVGGQELAATCLAVGAPGEALTIEATEDTRAMLIGGRPYPDTREIWWNFVATSKERLERAKAKWAQGRFPKVPGDSEEFIPLPDEPPQKPPPGTIL